MNSEIIKPTNGGELRELARKNPEDALFFLKKNLNIWNEIAIANLGDMEMVLIKHQNRFLLHPHQLLPML